MQPRVIAIASCAAYAADPFDISLKSVGARIFLGVSMTSSPFTWVPHANRTKLPVAGGSSDHTPCSRTWPCGPTSRESVTGLIPSSRQSADTEVSRCAIAAWANRTWAFDSANVLPPWRPRAPRGRESGQGAFADQLPLELGQRREDAEYEAAGGGGRCRSARLAR